MKAVLLVLLLVLPLAGCSQENRTRPVPRPGVPAVAPPATIPQFDAGRAFSALVRQTAFGPRNPNSPGHAACRDWLVAELRSLGAAVQLQEFSHTGYDGEQLALTNIIASFLPSSAERVLLCAHWDTRPRAEHDDDPARRDEPIIGANDGASGVAVLLEIARLMAEIPPPIGVDIVLFDGEDYGMEEDLARYLLGSRHFALNIHPDSLPQFGILLDMVGDAHLEIPREGHSVDLAPDIVDLVWSAARRLGRTEFVEAAGDPVYDDHLPLNEVGIKTVDLIDFSYPDPGNSFWHTHKDTPDHCSPASLEAVGSVLVEILYGGAR